MEKEDLTIEQIHRMKIRQGFNPYWGVQGLTREECCLIIKYGAWLRALGQQTILPITEAQKHFVLVVAGSKIPETVFEHLWLKFLRLETEKREKHITNAKDQLKKNEQEHIVNAQVLSDRVEQNQAALSLRKIERYQNYAAMKYRCGACDRPVELCSCGD